VLEKREEADFPLQRNALECGALELSVAVEDVSDSASDEEEVYHFLTAIVVCAHQLRLCSLEARHVIGDIGHTPREDGRVQGHDDAVPGGRCQLGCEATQCRENLRV
jgi:hypothetical protein